MRKAEAERGEAPKKLSEEKARDQGRGTDFLSAADEEPAAPSSEPLVFEQPILAPSSPRVLTVTIRARPGGRLVLDGVVDADLDWTDADLWVVAADGTRTKVTALPGTTRSGRLSAGQVLRLVIAWTGADPVRIEASWLQLVIA
jgi:hypothetical protein